MKNKITLKNIVKNLDAIVTCTTLAICVILVNCNVIMRYFFNNPIRWSEEVVTSLFVWTVFIGSAAPLTPPNRRSTPEGAKVKGG